MYCARSATNKSADQSANGFTSCDNGFSGPPSILAFSFAERRKIISGVCLGISGGRDPTAAAIPTLGPVASVRSSVTAEVSIGPQQRGWHVLRFGARQLTEDLPG